MIQHPLFRVLILAIAVAVVSTGCSTTRVVNQWKNPDSASARFSRILVIGVSTQSGIRRTFEDEFVARLRAAGVDAVPSYRYIPEDGRVDENRLREAIRQANADGVLITRLVRKERETDITPGTYVPGPALSVLYPGYHAYWLGYYEPPVIRQYDVYTSETSLYDARTNQLVWTATARTTALGDLAKEIRRYVNTVVKALARNNLLAAT